MPHTSMRLVSFFSLALTAAAILPAQSSLIFTGRFNHESLDVLNERAGGSLTQLRAFDIAVVTPGPGAVARTWIPTTAHQAMWGDGNKTGNHAFFQGFNPFTAPNQFNFTGPFVKYADRAKADARLFFWTVRDESATAPQKLDVFTSNGTAVYSIKPGDYFRFGANGNAELFLTRALIMKAKGLPPPSRIESPGIGALCQDAAGNLYYSPQQGGHWVSGNYGTANPQFCNDGGICMIDAANITYDANGNVQDVVADTAHMLIEEIQPGPNAQPHVRNLVANAAAYNNTGLLLLTTTTKMVGLALDPNGGTWTASWPVGTTFPTVPHLVFTWDSGSWAGTIFSTANNASNQPGSIAVINGVKCGSDVLNVPATGAWLGTKQDLGKFTPTTMGFAIIDALPFTPFGADAPNDGAILSTDLAIAVDLFPGPLTPCYVLLSPGPFGVGAFQPSLDVSAHPLLSPESWKRLWLVPPIEAFFVGLSNLNGYATFLIPNLWNPALLGVSVEFQGLKSDAANRVVLSNPVQMQFK